MRTFETAVLAAGTLLVGLAPIAAAQDAPGVHVCVAADRVLRHAPAGTCPAGQEGYYLAEAEPELGTPDRDEKPVAQVADLQQRLATLVQRVASLEQSSANRAEGLAQRVSKLEAAPKNEAPPAAPPASRVRAPFEVVDASGKPIFVVTAEPTRAFYLKNASGEAVALGSAQPHGGFFKVTSGDGDNRQAVMGALDSRASFFVRGTGKVRGVFALETDDKPILSLSNEKGSPILALHEDASGGGYIQVGDAAGVPLVEAHVAEGVGEVVTGPTYKCVGFAGPTVAVLVPDCIKGKRK